MTKRRKHHAALWLCVDNSSSAARGTPRSSQPFNSDKCQPPGMRLRVRHLRICHSDAPRDFATSAIARQRKGENKSMPDNGDRLSPLSRTTFHLRDKVSLPCFGMAEKDLSPDQLRMKVRMVAMRKKVGKNKREMAAALQIEYETYKKQEQRGTIPRYLLVPYAAVVGETVDYVLTGVRPKGAPEAAETPALAPPAGGKRARKTKQNQKVA